MSPQPVATRLPWRGRSIVLLGITLVALNLRIAVASVSPVLDDVRADLALSATEVGLLGTIPVVSFAVFGSVSPMLARRIDLEPSVILAMAVSALGEVLRSTTSSPTAFLGWSVIALAGMGMGNVLLPPLVKRYFPDRIGAVTAVYAVAMGFSTAVPPLLAVPLAVRHGWRFSIGSWAVLAVVAVIPWLVVIWRSAAARSALGEVFRRAPTHTPALASRHRARGRVWRSPMAWGLAVAFGMNSLNTYTLFAWLPQILADAGLDAAAAGTGLALFAAIGLPAALVVPPLTERMHNPIWLVVGLATGFIVGYGGLIVSPDRGLALWLILLGFGGATFPVFLTLINLRTRTSAGASSLSGFAQGVGYTFAATGPFVVGLLYDATGRWDPGYVFLYGTIAVLLVAAVVACRPVMLEDTWGGIDRLDR